MKWPVKKLGDYIEITMGQAPHSDACNKEGSGTIFVKAGEFSIEAPLIREWTTNPLKMARDGDTLVCVVGATAGKINRSRFECAIGRSVAAVRTTTKNLDQEFLHSFLKTKINVLRVRSQGAAQAVITREMLQDIEFGLPPLAEQQRISALLDLVDNLLHKREQAITKLDELVQSVFMDMLSQKNNFTTEERLGDICDVRDGTHGSPKYVNEGMPLVTSKNLTNGVIDLLNANLISKEDFDAINKRSKVDYGDILMPMIGTIGNPVIVDDINPQFAIKNVALIKSKQKSPNLIYIKAILESRLFYVYIDKLSRGGTQKFLGLGDIRKFPIPILKIDSEKKIVSTISEINALRINYLLDVIKQKKLIASLQHQSFAIN